MQRIVSQRNVTYILHCNRHALSAVNCHKGYTVNDGCTVETCLLKLKKSYYFKKFLWFCSCLDHTNAFNKSGRNHEFLIYDVIREKTSAAIYEF